MKWLGLLAVAVLGQELLVALPGGAGRVGLSTRGPSAFRVRFLFDNSSAPMINTPMVAPDKPDAAFKKNVDGTGIVTNFGSVVLSATGVLSLWDSKGTIITQTLPLGSSDVCSSINADVTSAERVADALRVADEAACCNACKGVDKCTNWIYGLGDPAGNCWLVQRPVGIHPSNTRTMGGTGLGHVISFTTTRATRLYGKGAGASDAEQLTATSVSPHVENREAYAPYYYSTDGYSALGVVNVTTGNGKTNYFPASYSTSGALVTWSYSGTPDFEVYLMPAASLDQGTIAYYDLVGAPAIPPRYAFGFIASRWGWSDRAYIESILHSFRDGNYPIDAFICDFGWFTNVSDYDFPSQGYPWYKDFGFYDLTFPDPQGQLKMYHDDLHFKMGGIRKPRLGNTDLLNLVREKGWLFAGGEYEKEGQVGYAVGRNMNYSITAARDWYAEQQQHYISDGVDFFWNDEGETDYFTFYWWNVAQQASQRLVDPDKRFFSINRNWSPGQARLGATAWTGDINPSWDDLQKTPGMILNWGLAGAPYVACDIGGFTSDTNALLLTRWYQVGIFMPVMRVHSTKSATPHFPFLWDEPYRSAMRDALNLRYRLIPYHYSLAHAMYATNRLWMRALIAEYPQDANSLYVTSQWLDGRLLASPVLNEDNSKHIYLPAGTWFVFNSSSTLTGPQQITGSAALTEVPVFVQTPTLLPLGPLVQHTDALPGGPLEMQIYTNGSDCSFDLVEDDGVTMDYTVKGYRTTHFTWSHASSTLSWTVVSGAEMTLPHSYVNIYASLFSTSSSTVRRSDVKPLDTKGSITF